MSPLGESPERDRLGPLRTETFLRTLPSLRWAGCRVTRYGAPCPASASSEGGRSLRRSTCDAPASLRLTSLPESSARTPRPSAAPPPSRPAASAIRDVPGEWRRAIAGLILPSLLRIAEPAPSQRAPDRSAWGPQGRQSS